MKAKEIVLISGKGGTGKTSLTASLIPYLENTVLADCDVDAPDLDLLLKPTLREDELFFGTRKAVKKQLDCRGCAACLEACRFHAVTPDFQIKPTQCEGCAVCTLVCPENLFEMKDSSVGRIFRSDTAYGPFIHARLFPGEETSGRLVSEVRKRAAALAESENKDFILIDGSPGIGCNVISSLTGADLAVVVTEPTRSGLHDLERVFTVLKKFSVPALTVINRCDISNAVSTTIEDKSCKAGFPTALKIPFYKGMIQSVSRLEIPSLGEQEFFEKIGWSHFVDTLKQT